MSIASILARYHAEKAVHARLRQEKIKPAEVVDLQRMAAAYLDEHGAELLKQAERTIAGSPVLQRMVAVQKRLCNAERNRQQGQWALVQQARSGL